MKPLDEKLTGTWVTQEEDSDAVFAFIIKDGIFEVSGFERSDNEAFEITNVVWDGNALSFTAVMPSTGFRTQNIFRLRLDGNADLAFTSYEVWKKIETTKG